MTALLEGSPRDAWEKKINTGVDVTERRDRMCLTCVLQRQQHPRGSSSRGRLLTDKGKIDKIVLQIPRYQHVCNVVVMCGFTLGWLGRESHRPERHILLCCSDRRSVCESEKEREHAEIRKRGGGFGV